MIATPVRCPKRSSFSMTVRAAGLGNGAWLALLALALLPAGGSAGAAAAPVGAAPDEGAVYAQYYGSPPPPNYGQQPQPPPQPYGAPPAQPYGGQPYGAPPPNGPSGNDQGGEAVHISDATYAAGNLGHCDASQPLRDRCEGQASCDVHADDRLCGDPARGQRKTLIIGYKCGGKRRELRLLQDQSARLHC